MAQGNPFQEWGGGSGRAATAVTTNDPFGQFPFQQLSSQQEQQRHAGSSQQHLGLPAASLVAPASQYDGSSAGYAPQFHPLQAGRDGGGGGNGVDAAGDNPFDFLFASSSGRGQPVPAGSGAQGRRGGDAVNANTSSVNVPSPSSINTNGMMIASAGDDGRNGGTSVSAATFQRVAGQQSGASPQQYHHQQPIQNPHEQVRSTSPSRFGQRSEYDGQQQQQRPQQQGQQQGMMARFHNNLQQHTQQQQEKPAQPSPASTTEGSAVSALVPFGHPFDLSSQQQPYQPIGGQTTSPQGATAQPSVGPGAMVSFQLHQEQPQQQQLPWGQGGIGSPVKGDNPFDDLFSSAIVPYGNGSASTPAAEGGGGARIDGSFSIQQQPRPPHWHVQQQPQQQQQKQQHQQDWLTRGNGGQQQQREGLLGGPTESGVVGPLGFAEVGGDAAIREQGGATMPPSHHQQQAWSGGGQGGWTNQPSPQRQPQFQPQVQPFHGNAPSQGAQRSASMGAMEFNPFFPSGGEQQQKPGAAVVGDSSSPAGLDVFSDDPFGRNTPVLTTTDGGFIALTGAGHAVTGAAITQTNPDAGGFGPPSDANFRGSGASPTGPISANDPFDPFDLASFTPDLAGASGGGGGREEDGVGDLGSGERGRGRVGSRSVSARKSGTGRVAGTPPFRDGGSHRASGAGRRLGGSGDGHRSSSVPRSLAVDRGLSSDSDPFDGNSGRHGRPQRSLDDSDQNNRNRPNGSGSSSTGRRSSYGRSITMGDVLDSKGGGDRGRENQMPAGGRAGRGRGAPSQHVSEVHHEERDSLDEGEDEEDADYGSDSDNDDTLSVMDPDAVRAAMGARSGTGRGTAGPAEYVVEFERERKLGMLLERHDEWPEGTEARSERAVVKMVVDNGPAQTRGVTVGSKVKKVNGEAVAGLTYQETLERIKNASRPLQVHFERGELVVDDNVGKILFKKTVGVPRSFSAWQRRYYVLGGAVAKSNVLQVYVSKQSYDRMVLAVFGRQRINEPVKAYRLNTLFKCGPIKVKKYKSHPSALNYFTVKLPTSRLKQLNFASHSLSDLQHLRSTMSRFTSRS